MNLLTLACLLGLLAADGDESQAKPAPPSAPAQDADRPAISATDLKALRDTNIFAPKNMKKRPPPTSGGTVKLPPAPYKQKPPVLTAIFFDAASKAHQVIVEDRNDSTHRYFKEPKFMKAGDEWAGVKIDTITQDVAVFSKGDASKEVRIGEALPEVDVKPPSSTDGSDDGVSDDGESPATADPSTSKVRRPAPESKTQTSEEQNRVLEEMRRRNKKKNRPGAPEE
jgi:hypothetical protein